MHQNNFHNCLQCLNQYNNQMNGCVSNCLQQSGVEPNFAYGILTLTALAAILLFSLSFLFRSDLKKFLAARLASVGFFGASLFTLVSIFTFHTAFTELPWLIPAVAVGSYLVSHFFSFNLMKRSYGAKPLANLAAKNFLKKISNQLKISCPQIFSFSSEEAKAFSVDGSAKAIFLSDSLLKKLSAKDLAAVLLHELYHIKRRSGAWKNFFSAAQNLSLRILPLPIDLLEKREEKEVDELLEEKHGIDMAAIRKKLWN